MLKTERTSGANQDATSGIADRLLRQWEAEHSIRVTVDGVRQWEIRDADSFRALMSLAERLETIEALHAGIEPLERGEGLPASQVFDALRRKYGMAN